MPILTNEQEASAVQSHVAEGAQADLVYVMVSYL